MAHFFDEDAKLVKQTPEFNIFQFQASWKLQNLVKFLQVLEYLKKMALVVAITLFPAIRWCKSD